MFHRLAAQNLNVNVVQQSIASIIRYSKGKKQIFQYSLFNRPESGFVRVKNIWLVIMTGDQLSVIFSPDVFPTKETHDTTTHFPSYMCSLTQETHITREFCSPIQKKKFLVICVPLYKNHTSLVIGVPLARKHNSLKICVALNSKHIITRNMCSRAGEQNNITTDMCSPTQETHITSDMCSPTQKTHNHQGYVFAYPRNTNPQ